MPKILFITADQWRGDCLGALGHPCLRTPTLDALAAEGVTFTRHFAQCSPCGPSRASLHTGMSLMNHRSVANGVPLYVHFPSLPPLLFDLKRAPGELCNLAGDPAHASVLCDLARRMLSHRMRHAERTLTGMFLSPERGVIHAHPSRRPSH